MRTTLDIESDVLETAKALAAARGVSIGKALSELARRGASARIPIVSRNGFPVFQLHSDSPKFGLEDVAVGLEEEDLQHTSAFLSPQA